MLHIINVLRFSYEPDLTKSIIFVDNNFFGYGLEPPRLEGFLPVGTRDAIPEGVYNLVLSFSNKFKKMLPEVQCVPQNSGIRIHSGNTVKDTAGCLLIGTGISNGSLSSSIIKITELVDLLKKWQSKKEVTEIIYSALELNDKLVRKCY